ncbi:polysaccharide deacetylase family protein [Flavicella sediminum]|uniref:polysaccharide deacetylase family protein n=1 Tax=Flavicella sediminum TaxID=2585141 RepID=UPI001FB6093A|nr:polysaccharide deacetylase family protein [Flavicella sediminum]
MKNYIWAIPKTDQKTIYLTFDDGPIPEITEWVLNELREFNAKATFFCIGNNIEKHPDVFEAIVSAGHQVGNHTFQHVKGWKENLSVYKENVLATEKLLEVKLGYSPKIMRPPYGKIKCSQSKYLRKLGYKIVMWDVLSADFDTNTSAKECFSNVLKNVEDGSIVVFHDSVKAAENMKYALPKVLAHFSKEGFVFKKLNI